MYIKLLDAKEWEHSRFALLRFVSRHGGRRITQAGWRGMARANAEAFADPCSGTAIAVAYTAGGLPAGIAFAARYGEDACIVAVHSALRSRGIGRSLLSRLAEHLGRLSCCVAADNYASLAMFNAAGFAAVGLENGPTGKPTLRLARSSRGADAEADSLAALGLSVGQATPTRR